MKQVLQVPRSGLTVVRDLPLPRCAPGGVLVHNAFSAISSGTERARVELAHKSLLGKARARPDLVREVFDHARRQGAMATARAIQGRLGQEIPVGYSSAGMVVEVGEHVRGLQPGDRVACVGATANHAEFVNVPANLCAPVPDNVPLEAAALSAIAAIAVHGIRLSEAGLGSRVAVIGCGLVGQIALRLLRAAGAETFALDIDQDRVQQAASAGADHAYTIDSSTPERVWTRAACVGVDAVVVAAAAPTSEPLLLAARIARERGSLILVGAVPIEFPRAPLYEKELRFRVSRSYGPGRYDPEYEERGLDYPIAFVRWTEKRNMEAVLRLQAQGLLSLLDLIEVLPVDQAADAYARLIDGQATRPRGAIVLAYDGATHSRAGSSGITELHVSASDGQAPLAPSATVSQAKRGTARAPARVGLIGPGSFARRVLIPALHAAGAQLVAVGSASGSSASAVAQTAPSARLADGASAVINDPEVDAVVIATRHGSHAALVAESLAAGKHVFCEKPLALTLDERNSVMSAAEAAEATLTVGFNRRFSPLLQTMRSFLEGPHLPMTLVYRVSAGKLPDGHWIYDLTQGGGRALGEMCHFVDSVAFLAGSPVLEVHANGHSPDSKPLQAYENVVVTLQLADSSVAALVYVADGSPRVSKERIEGFCGPRTAILHDYEAIELFDSHRHRKRRIKAQGKGHREEIAAFLKAVQTGEPAVPLWEIDNSTIATMAIVEALRTGRSVRLSPYAGPCPR